MMPRSSGGRWKPRASALGVTLIFMDQNKTISQKWGWVVGVVVFLFACWLCAYWEDFKEGFVGGYSTHTGSHP